jgi:hypothetical protein
MIPASTIGTDGSGLASVTRIISDAGLGVDFSMIPPAKMAAAQARGNLAHKACELDALGILDEATVPESTMPYLDAFRDFRAAVGWRPILIETRLVHPLGFTGQPDTVGWLGSERLQLDLKTPLTVSPGPILLQLAAYDALHRHNFPAEPLQGTAVLQLRPDGTYRLRRRDPVEIATAWTVFVAAFCMLRGTATDAQIRAIAAWARRYPS